MGNGWKAMDIDVLINRIGFVLSLGGAAFSWWQATRAKKIKDEIKDDRLKIALVELIAKGNSARSAAQKLAPLTHNKQSRGFNPEDSLKVIQNFIEKFNDNKHLLNTVCFTKLFNELKDKFAKYKNEEDVINQEKIGNVIYEILNSIISELNKSFDEKS